MVEVRVAREDEWAQARDLRLEMLADSPRSFIDRLDIATRWDDARWQARMRSHLAPDSTVVVAVVGDDWVGHAAGRVFGNYDAPRAYVLGVYVTPLYRGQGLAARMMDVVGQWALDQGIDRLHLDVHEGAEPARSSYLRQGFEFTGARSEHPEYPGEFELEMVKRLV